MVLGACARKGSENLPKANAPVIAWVLRGEVRLQAIFGKKHGNFLTQKLVSKNPAAKEHFLRISRHMRAGDKKRDVA